MTPDQIQLLRRLALNEREAVNAVMSGELATDPGLDPRTSALVRIAVLLSMDADPTAVRWEVEAAIAAGVEDSEVFAALLEMAPMVGMARLTSSLPHLLAAYEIDLIDS